MESLVGGECILAVLRAYRANLCLTRPPALLAPFITASYDIDGDTTSFSDTEVDYMFHNHLAGGGGGLCCV